jgi:hypothetical protein
MVRALEIPKTPPEVVARASLEAAGGFGLPASVDASYTRLIDALDTAFATWSVSK